VVNLDQTFFAAMRNKADLAGSCRHLAQSLQELVVLGSRSLSAVGAGCCAASERGL
jgi:hypothetical protein